MDLLILTIIDKSLWIYNSILVHYCSCNWYISIFSSIKNTYRNSYKTPLKPTTDPWVALTQLHKMWTCPQKYVEWSLYNFECSIEAISVTKIQLTIPFFRKNTPFITLCNCGFMEFLENSSKSCILKTIGDS